jgi:hypothetical protein
MGYGIDDGEDAYFDGIMDDVRVYDYALILQRHLGFQNATTYSG